MKKKLVSLLLTSLIIAPALSACNNEKVEPIDEGETVSAVALKAVNNLGVIYSTFSSDGVLFGETNLETRTVAMINDEDEKGLIFSVSYQVTPMYEYSKEYLKLVAGEEGTKLVVDEIVLKDDLPKDAQTLGGAAYTLKGTFRFEGYEEGFVAPKGYTPTDQYIGTTVSKSWNSLVKVTTIGDFQTIKGVQANEYVLFYGRFGGWYDKGKSELYSGAFVYDGDDAVMIYAGSITEDFYGEGDTLLIQPGDPVSVFGYASPYNGLFEVKPKKVTKLAESDPHVAGIKALEYKHYTVEELNKCGVSDTGRFVETEALKIKELPSKDYTVGKHWTIKAISAADATKEINIYVNYHVGEESQTAIKAFLDDAKAGDKAFTFKGVLSAYNSNQLTPVNTASGNAAQCFILA